MRLIDIIGKATPDEAHRALRKANSSGVAACPAARLCGSAGVECGIEEVLISPDSDPTTMTRLCADRYELCPTWRRNVDEGQTASEFGKQVRAIEAARADKDNALLERLEHYGRQG